MPQRRWKVVEVPRVTQASLADAITDGIHAGWTYERTVFVRSAHSQPPRMAFLVFWRRADVPTA